MDIDGIGAIVTGAGRGLGAEVARALARRGARVVLVARTGADVERVAAAIRAEGGAAHAIAADVADKRAPHAIAGAAAALVGNVDLLVNNASSLGHVPLRLLADTDCEALEESLAVNLVGPFRLTKIVLGSMLLRGRGVVVDVTSDASTSAYAKWGAYGAAKAALDHLGRIWGAELEGSGVRLVSVDPGEMRTQMHADAVPDADPSTLLDPEEVARRVIALVRAADSVPNGARVEAAAYAGGAA